MYVLLLPKSFSISLDKSLDISSDEMLAKVHSASPTAYMFEWFISLAVSPPSHPNPLLQRIRYERQHLLVLVQEEHDAQISETFIAESRTGHELQTLDLAEMGRVAEHVNVQQFGDIVVSRKGVFLFEGCLALA
jgi:hypothetical protein